MVIKMEEYRNDKENSLENSEKEMQNVRPNENGDAGMHTAPFAPEEPVAQSQQDHTQEPQAEQGANSQRPAAEGAGAYHPGYTPYMPLGDMTNHNFSGQDDKSVDPAFVQKDASGEYRYHPPYAPGPAESKTASSKKKKKERKKKSGGAIALIVAACLLFSFGTGLGGAYFGLLLSRNSGGAGQNGDDPLVIYKTAVIADAEGEEITEPLSQSQVYEMVKNSVVEITTDFLSSYGNFQYVSSGAGSGVIVSEDGYIVTNNHVIVSENKVADTIKIRLTDGTEYEASLVGRDEDSDIALLKIDATGLDHAIFGDSSTLEVGDQVMAVGNPLGELGGTATSGIVSATDREITVDDTQMTLIQIDAAINPGNSGGGLFNMKGELVGIVNAKSTGTEIEGLGFAIPVNDAEHVIEELQTNGYVTGKIYIGVSLYEAQDAYTAYYYFRSQAPGVYVMQLVDGYNDDALQVGDRIIAVDGAEITSVGDVEEAISDHVVGDVLTFTVYRDGQMMDVEVTCYEYKPDSNISFSE